MGGGAAKTYGKVAVKDGRVVLSGVEAHVAIRLKQLFPRINKATSGPFFLGTDDVTLADLDWFFSRYPMAGDIADLTRIVSGRKTFEARQSEAERLLREDYRPPAWVGLKEGKSLRPHQAASAHVLQLFGGLLVGDDVGEGKTFTGIAAMLLEGALPAIVICDPHLQKQWRNRIEDWTGLSTHMVNSTMPYALPPRDVFIFRYTQLAGWVDIFPGLGPGLVVADEMQNLRRGDEALKGQAAAELFRVAPLRLGMTATPVYNYGSEMFEIMGMLRPGLLGDRAEFYREWCTSGGNGKYFIKDPKALGTFLRENHAFVRKRKPGDRVNRIIQPVDYDEAAMASVEDLARALAVTATTGKFTERGEATRELDMMMRMITGVAKAPFVAKVVRILLEGGAPVVLFGWHRDVYDIWLRDLADFEPAMYTGSETPAKKSAELKRFLEGQTDLFIMSLRSGQGLDDLQTRASTIVFGELDWSPQTHNQCIGRLDRERSVVDGTDEDVTAIYLVADDGSDPPMMEMLGLKASAGRQIVDPDLGVSQTRSDGGGLSRLVERYLTKRGRG